MNAESKINIHYSSLVGLKAELLRKQTEVEAAKSKQENVKLINKIKTKDKSFNEKKKPNKLDEKTNSNEVKDDENTKVLQKSKLMLQAKSRLYNKLAKTHTNLNPNFLVDFKHKPDEADNLEDNDSKFDNDYKSDCDSDSEWVEYTDCFGRTRKCLQEDLPKMQEKDESIRKKINKPQEGIDEGLLFVEDRLPNKEPEIEIMRKKWEEQTAKLSNKVNIHYEDVLFDEARTHGVGYYAFSQDEAERLKQQENLIKLRKETEQKQKENQEIRDMKDKLQQNRLRVARLRQRIRAGLPIDEIDESKSTTLLKLEEDKEKNIEIDKEIGNKIEVNNESRISEEIVEASNCKLSNEKNNVKSNNETNTSELDNTQVINKNKLADIENKIEAFGQLLGKRNRWYVMSQEEWIHKKRNERTTEFGPVYENFQSGETLSEITTDLKNSDNYADSNDSSTIGPLPIIVDNSNLEPDQLNVPENSAVAKFDLQSYKDSKVNANIEYQVEAGLKYLRQQFEKKHV